MNFLKNKTVLFAIFMSLIVAIGIWYYYHATEPYSETIDLGYSSKAKRNNFLAMDYLFNELGSVCTSSTKIDFENIYEKDVLLIPLERLPSQEAQLELLKNWLESGGVLITGSIQNGDRFDQEYYVKKSVLDFLNITKISASSGKNSPLEEVLHSQYKLSLSHVLEVDFSGYKSVIQQNGKTYLAKREYGIGEIIFLNSLEGFTNQNINSSDNANFIVDYFHSEIFELDGMLIDIVYTGHDMTMWRWLWENAFSSIMLLILIVLGWLLCVSKRFGPILPVYTHGSRKIMEHIEATGDYLWSGNLHLFLVKDLQQMVMEKIQFRFPSWIRKNTVSDELVKLTKLSKLEIEKGLFDNSEQLSEENFLEKIKILKKIKEAL